MRYAIKLISAIVAIFSLGGCVSITQLDMSPKTVAASGMTARQARATLRTATGTICGVLCGDLSPELRGIELSDDGARLVLVESNGDRSNTLPVQALKVSAKTVDNLGWVYFNDDLSLATSAVEAKNVGTALIVIQNAPNPVQEQAAFASIAATYQASNPKPEISEDVRRYFVMAQTAIDDKRFSDAVNAYERGLALAPWWPEGHFNCALVLGELQAYDEAIDHMKKYIALVPDAPNARAAQDKIYAWESKQQAVTQ